MTYDSRLAFDTAFNSTQNDTKFKRLSAITSSHFLWNRRTVEPTKHFNTMGASRAACDVCIFIAFANKQGNSKFNLESCLVLNLTGYSMLLINRRMKITSRRRFQFAYSLIFPRLPIRHCWPSNNNL